MIHDAFVRKDIICSLSKYVPGFGGCYFKVLVESVSDGCEVEAHV